MPTPVAVHQQIDEALMEHDAMYRKSVHPDSPGGITITDGEARLQRVHFYRAVAVAGLKGSDDLRVISSITRSEDGVRGHRPLRHIHNIVKLRGRSTADDQVPA